VAFYLTLPYLSASPVARFARMVAVHRNGAEPHWKDWVREVDVTDRVANEIIAEGGHRTTPIGTSLCGNPWRQSRHLQRARCDQQGSAPSTLRMFPGRGGWDRGVASTGGEQMPSHCFSCAKPTRLFSSVRGAPERPRAGNLPGEKGRTRPGGAGSSPPQATAAIVWLFPLAAILPQILWGVLAVLQVVGGGSTAGPLAVNRRRRHGGQEGAYVYKA
jgi:hypothetical protein